MHISRSRSMLVAMLVVVASGLASADERAPFGFSATDAPAQLALEQRFDAALDAKQIGAWLEQLSSAANHVGAPHNKANAEFLLQQFNDWGWDAEIETYESLYPTPKRVALELIAPTTFTAKLNEPPIDGDATSSRTDGLPPYNVYGADGDVTGALIYVNQGMEEDYKELARRGIDVKGAIVIARYGGGWRGLKPKLAYEHGAIGCLIYSDPKEDGYAQGDTYPKGGWRPADAVQRGSVLDITSYAGDPLTPFVGATKRAKRLRIADATSLLKIPVLPISYADAKPLLEALTGPVAPEAWRGALPITYHMGPGAARVRLTVESDWSTAALYNVIARIPGSGDPDQWVVRGNHRDGWVFGAWDPLSGTVALMAEAKAIGALLGTGWRPRRTIVYASWDGEEPGLLGSTEWAEAHAAELQRGAVLYLNSDSNTRGFLSLAGSHSLQRFGNDVAAGVQDPETLVTVQERLRARVQVAAFEKGASEELKKFAKKAADGDIPLRALGSGSDFTPFLQHLGITTLNLSYGGEADQEGVYHSNYDSYDHYIRFGDPGFAYGVTQAQTVGRTVLRFANADVLPMRFSGFADAIDGYVQELHKLQDDRRTRSDELAKLIDKGAFALAADPTRPVLAPAREIEVPYVNLAPLDNALARLKKSATAYDDAYDKFARGEVTLTAQARASLNATLQGIEQTLTDARGLPGRPWYRHLVYAPGTRTGYVPKTLPGVREAIEQDRFDEANAYAAITAAALERYCDQLDSATALIR